MLEVVKNKCMHQKDRAISATTPAWQTKCQAIKHPDIYQMLLTMDMAWAFLSGGSVKLVKHGFQVAEEILSSIISHRRLNLFHAMQLVRCCCMIFQASSPSARASRTVDEKEIRVDRG